MEKIWLRHYPAGVPTELNTDLHPSLVALLDDALRRHGALTVCRFMGRSFSFAQIDQAALALAAYLQRIGLKRGDRVAVMLSNLPQFLVATLAVLRCGCVLVNVDPLSSPQQLAHQLGDSGALAIIALDRCSDALQQVHHMVPTRHVILASTGDLLGRVQRALLNHRQRRHRPGRPDFGSVTAVRFVDALALGRRSTFIGPAVGPDDMALLQYTGGTTGPSRGAVLLQRNLVASLLQAEAWTRPARERIAPSQQPTTACALPLHELFGFSANLLLSVYLGGCAVLVTDPSDTAAMLKELCRQPVHTLAASPAVVDAIAAHPAANNMDWSLLQLCIVGGAGVPPGTARRWRERSGRAVCASYGLSETGPLATCNPVDGAVDGDHLGWPLPGTDLALLDEAGGEVTPGMPGEIAIRGPQVMAGYWQRPDETARAVNHEGYFRTGDIGWVDERGCLRLVDRKTDLILVGSFNVYPNEIEHVVSGLPGVRECAAVGVPDASAGQCVKLLVVKQDPGLSEATIRSHCEAHLAGYQRPRCIEFRAALPKSSLGKLLRRELREAPAEAKA